MMKLSEAIRLSTTLGKQCFGSAYGSGNGEQICALAGAAMAIGLSYVAMLVCPPSQWHQLNLIKSDCPACTGLNERGTFNLVIHLNDYHRWNREQIADHVETLECIMVSPLQMVTP